MSIEQMASLKKIIAGFAAFGFILSFLTGLISGVLFGALLLRALLFAALFGGIGFAVTRLSTHFIPELFSGAPENFDASDELSIEEEDDDESAQEEAISGKKLGITVEDEPEENSGGIENAEELEPAKKSASQAEEVEDVEDAEELEPAEKSALQAEDVEELEDASEEPLSDEKVSAENNDEATKGSLPDIGEFADSFEQSGNDGSEVSSGLSSIDGAGERGVEVMDGMHDTQEITRAVQTILKRDQEG